MIRLRNILIIFGFCSLCLLKASAFAGNPDYNLFQISRSRDADIICYDVSLEADGTLNVDSPVNIYWVRKMKGSVHEPLTWIQNRYSYGINILETSVDHAKFRFVSFDSKDFRLKRSDEGRFKVYTSMDNNTVIVERIFVQFDGGTFLSPGISEVILYGWDVESGVLLTEDIRP
ncbi:MAG: DUF4833 domain-containing protein [Bacteroidales bacterium]